MIKIPQSGDRQSLASADGPASVNIRWRSWIPVLVFASVVGFACSGSREQTGSGGTAGSVSSGGQNGAGTGFGGRLSGGTAGSLSSGGAGGIGMGGTNLGGTGASVTAGAGGRGGTPTGGAMTGGTSGSGGTVVQGGAGGTMQGGTSGCAPDLDVCGGACVHKQTNPLHCGVCDRKCGAGTACLKGACQAYPQWRTPTMIGRASEDSYDANPMVDAKTDGQGNVFVVWPWNDGNDYKLWVNRFESKSNTWTGAVAIESGVTNRTQASLVGHRNGGATVVYRKKAPPVSYGLFSKQYRPQSGTWDANASQICSNCSNGILTSEYNDFVYRSDAVHVDGNRNGDVMVIWGDANQPRFNVYQASQANWLGESRFDSMHVVTTDSRELRNMRLAMDSRGNAILIRPTWRLNANRYDFAAKIWSANQALPMGDEKLPKDKFEDYFLCQNADGDVAILWRTEKLNGANKLAASTFDMTKMSWSAVPRVFYDAGSKRVTTNSRHFQNRCVLDDSQTLSSTWNESNERLLAGRMPLSSSMAAPVFPVSTNGIVRGEMISSDLAGSVVVVSDQGSARFDVGQGTWVVLNLPPPEQIGIPVSIVTDTSGRTLLISGRLVSSDSDPLVKWTELWATWLE